MLLIGQKKFFLLTKLKMQFYRLDRHVINDLNREKIVGIFYEKELQKTNERIEKELRIEKVFKTKGNKLYVK